MLIDWFTVIAQIVNFMVLVWLLQRFLYRPILEAVDSREKRIAMTVNEAEINKEAARKECDTFRLNNEEFSRQRASLLREAILEVKAEQEKLYEAARKEAEDFRRRQQEAMIDDCNTLKEEILRRTRDEVFAIARKTLADLAGAKLEMLMVETFIQRCRAMDTTEKSDLQSVLKSPVGPVCVRSTFPLENRQQEAMKQTIEEVFHYGGEFCFESSPDLISGIAVSIDGHEMAWNITDYLLALEKGVTDLLLGQSSPGPEERQLETTEGNSGNGTEGPSIPEARGNGE